MTASYTPLRYLVGCNEHVLPESTPDDYRFKYIDISQVDSLGRVDIDGAEWVTFGDSPSRARRLAPPNSTIISTVRTYLRAIGSVPIAKDPLIFSTGFAVLEARKIAPRYLTYACLSTPFIEQVVARSTGVSYPAINAGDLLSISIPTPNVEEQRRIAGFLDDCVARIDQIIAARQQQVQMFTEHLMSKIDIAVAAPTDSALTRLGRLATIQTGLTVDAARDAGPNATEYPYLRVANVQSGGLHLAEIKTVPVDPLLAGWFLLRSGDVLMTEGGDLDKLGRGTVWRGEIPNCLHQNHVFAVRCTARLLDPEFLAFYSQASPARAHFESTGSKSTNLASTSASKVAALAVPALSLTEQRARAASCREATTRHTEASLALRSSIARLQEYKQSLITAAVTGEFDVTTASTRIPE